MYDIIVVEDSRILRNQLNLIFESLGWKAGLFAGAGEAFSALEKSGARVFIVDVDLVTKDKSGLLQKIRQVNAELPIVGLSDNIANDKIDANTYDYMISKPLNMSNLARIISGFLVEMHPA